MALDETRTIESEPPQRDPLSSGASTKPRRSRWRWFQFSLRTLLVAVTILGIALGWWVRRAEAQRRALVQLKAWGAKYEYAGHRSYQEPSWLEQQVRYQLGRDYVDRVERVDFWNADAEIGDDDLAILGELRGLKDLNLAGLAISDDCLVHVSRLASLESVYFGETQVTRRGADWLRRAIPECSVYLYVADLDAERRSSWSAYEDAVESPLAPIHEAAKWGDIDAIEQDLASGVPVDLRVPSTERDGAEEGTTALMWAAARGQVEVVRHLIAAGADVNAASQTGLTPLMAAAGAVKARSGDPGRCLELLLEAGADPLQTDQEGHTAHGYACAIHEPLDQYYLRERSPLERPTTWIRRSNGGGVVIHCSIGTCFGGWSSKSRSSRAPCGDAACLRILLDAQPVDTAALLYEAVESADSERVSLLLDRCDPASIDPDSQLKILRSAAMGGDAPTFSRIFHLWPIAHPSLMSLAVSSHEGAEEKARLLLDVGLDPNVIVDEGDSPLLLALYEYGAPAAAALLDAGADPLANGQLHRAVLLAARNAPASVLERLLSFVGTPERLKTHVLDLALSEAAKSGHGANQKVRMLLDAGASIEILDDEGRTPLLCAAASGNMDVVVTLVEAGADINVTDDDGNTALMLVASRGEGVFLSPQTGGDAAKALLERGARQDVRNPDEETAWSRAQAIDHQEVLRLLRPQPDP